MSEENGQVNVYTEILGWSNSLPDWKSDALRRVIVQGDYSEKDVEEVLQLLKLSEGLLSEKEVSIKAVRVSKAHLPVNSSQGEKVLLKAMHGLQNVNAVVVDQKIEFLPKGLTIIYGRNAAGKSGYARVLKRACRARGEAKEVLPNVFDTATGGKTPSAKIDISKGAEDKTLLWKDEETYIDELGSISFFDSHCARVYVDEANDVSYIPYGLDLFDKLCQLLNQVKKKLKDEIELCNPDSSFIEELPEGTTIREFLVKVNAGTKKEDIEKLSNITDSEKTQLNALKEKLDEIQKQDPKVKAEEIRRRKRRVERLKEVISSIDKTISDEEVKNIKAMLTELETAQKAVEIASKNTFTDQPLKGVGTDPWRILFDAAKEFSEKYAYPGKEFPNVEDEARCVLCFQKLEGEAIERFGKFSDYMKDRTSQTYAENKKKWDSKYQELKQIQEKIEGDNTDAINEIQETHKDTADMVTEFFKNAKTRHEKILLAIEQKNFDMGMIKLELPLVELGFICQALEAKAKEYEGIAEAGEKSKIEKQYNELNSKELLRNNIGKANSYIDTLIKRGKIQRCIGEADTTAISRKCSELMELMITEKLKEELTNELKSLDINYLQVDLKKTGRSGVTFHQLKLKSDAYRNISLSEVLSEGEQRSIAIASFLAELQASGSCYSMVFDDPVSSLDHPRREQVARRLVKEALHRQTVVFTHDIIFLTALEEAAVKAGVDCKIQTIWSSKKGIGYCDPNAPWLGQNVKSRISYLKGQLLPKIESLSGNPGSKDEYSIRVNDFFKKLRETWERAIEEVVFNDTIQRFRDSVETNRLKSVKFDDDDYKVIDEAMSFSSSYLHDRAAGKGEREAPEPKILKEEIDKLEKFVKTKRDQQDDTRKQR